MHTTIVFQDAILPKAEALRFSEKVQAALNHVLDDTPYNDYASMSVYDMVESLNSFVGCNPARKLRDAALLIFKTDWPCAVENLKRLKIVVEGLCPECGEELIEMFKQTHEATYTNPAEGIEYLECPKCSYSDYNERI